MFFVQRVIALVIINSDRRIDDYYEKICSGKQEKPFHEIILQIGNKDEMGAKTADREGVGTIKDMGRDGCYVWHFMMENRVSTCYNQKRRWEGNDKN